MVSRAKDFSNPFNIAGGCMRINKYVTIISVALCLSYPLTALAYGHQGHETVGLIAASLIKGTNAEKQVKRLLQKEETLATASEWADCAKGFTYCHADPTEEMKDFVQRNPNHHAYHYTDIPFQLRAYKKGEIGTTPDDVVNIMEDAIRVLKNQPQQNPAHNLKKREALVVLVHMTGDIHQPMHVGAAYISEDDEFIVPRNEEEAKSTFTQGGNLLCDRSKGVHSYWDTDLVLRAMRVSKVKNSVELAQVLLTKAKKIKVDPGVATNWPMRWATESLQLSELELAPITVVQKRKAGPGRSPCEASDPNSSNYVWDVRLPDEYGPEGATTVSEQLSKAGARLAWLLRAIWP
jgi:hypothetical protein